MRVFVQGNFSPGGLCLGGFSPGGFCPDGYCLGWFVSYTLNNDMQSPHQILDLSRNVMYYMQMFTISRFEASSDEMYTVSD